MFFKHYLSDLAGVSLLSPRIYTINEFMVELSGLQPADPVDLLFEVYKAYLMHTDIPESLDDFYHWGEVMIHDFDDLDKSMVNAESLFTNILDIKKIDTLFDYLSDEQRQTMKKFWGSFSENNISLHQDKFLSFWKSLYPIYISLNKKLMAGNTGYEGMIYRHVAERIMNGDIPELSYIKIILAGFNALSEAEKILFRYFRNSGTGKFYWDYDPWYIQNPVREAGRFIRKNLKEFPGTGLPDQSSDQGSRQIWIYELPSDITQAKFVSKLLRERDPAEMKEFHDTAIILCDENLLLPVLYSIPGQVADINVTMGYPLNLTPVYDFINHIIKLQAKIAKQTGKKENKFYYKHVMAVLDHQYLKLFPGIATDDLKSEILSRNIIYADESQFKDKGILELIFTRIKDVNSLIDYLIHILYEVLNVFSTTDTDQKDRLEKEYIYQLLVCLRIIRRIYEKHMIDISIETFSRLFRKIIRSSRFPFEGEPLGGIQVMGILETRLLDFRNLIFLSMNEGVMPATHTSLSFIPRSLRHAFNMSIKEDHDAIYAYYFHRLLQRSENVHLLYNSKTEGVYGGEISRYLYQLIYDRRFRVHQESIGFDIAERNPVEIIIPKNTEVIQKLNQYLVTGDHSFSPTCLGFYLDCRLKFYLSRIAELKEPDEITEEIEMREMGVLLHETMYHLYKPWKGFKISDKVIRDLLNPRNIEPALNEAFRKMLYRTSDRSVELIPEGENIIKYEVIKKYVQKILSLDLTLAPFEILSLEENYENILEINTIEGMQKIRIKGKIDRIDRKGNLIRIIDYKTGKEETSFNSFDELFDRETASKYKAILQTLIYAWIYNSQLKGSSMITTGLYLARKIFDKDFVPSVMLNKHEINFQSVSENLTQKLKETIGEIFDPGIPFDQTEDIERCRICPYARICHRKLADNFK